MTGWRVKRQPWQTGLQTFSGRGVITAWLSLLLLFMVSVILVCLESARTAVVRTSAERYADMAAEMTFSAYVRPLADRYGIFLLDQRGEGEPGQIFETFLKMNLEKGAQKGKRPFGLYGTVSSGGLTGAYHLQDHNWDHLYEQIRRCELYSLGEDGLQGLLGQLKSDGLSRAEGQTGDLQTDLQEREQAANDEKAAQEAQTDAQAGTDSGEEAGTGEDPPAPDRETEEKEEKEEDLRPGISRWLGQGLVHLVMGDQKISGRKIDPGAASFHTGGSSPLAPVTDFSGRDALSGSLGSDGMEQVLGQDAQEMEADALTGDRAGKKGRQMLLNLYILDRFSDLKNRNSEEKQVLRYELEYILYGSRTDQENLEKTITSLFALRTALNLAWLYADEGMNAQAARAAASVAGAALPAAGELLALLLLACWAAAESVIDCRALVSGKKIPIWKSDASWQLSFSALKDLAASGGTADRYVKGTHDGLSYRQYLLLLLIPCPAKKKIVRMLQLIEGNIRLEEGYEELNLKKGLTGAVFSADVSAGQQFFRHPSEGTFHCRAAYIY